MVNIVGKKSYIHVLQSAIRRNHTGLNKDNLEPVIEVKSGDFKWHANGFDLVYKDVVVASFIYRPENPLPSGARLWVEVPEEVKIRGTK